MSATDFVRRDELDALHSKLDELIFLVQRPTPRAVHDSTRKPPLTPSAAQDPADLAKVDSNRFSGVQQGTRKVVRRGALLNLNQSTTLGGGLHRGMTVRRKVDDNDAANDAEELALAETVVLTRDFDGLGADNVSGAFDLSCEDKDRATATMPWVHPVRSPAPNSLLIPNPLEKAMAPPSATKSEGRRKSASDDDYEGFATGSVSSSFDVSTNRHPNAGARRVRVSKRDPNKAAHSGEYHTPPCLNQLMHWWRAWTIDANHPVVVAADVTYIAVCTAYVLLLVSVFVSPIEIGPFDQPPAAFVVALSLTLVFTALWVLLRSFARYTNGPEIVDNPRLMRAEYRKSFWIVVDALTVLPLEFIFVVASPLTFYILLVRHPVLRIVRVLKLSHSTDPLLPNNRHWILLVGFLSTALVLIHLGACIYWTLEGFDTYKEGHPPLQYTDAVYFALATLTSTGYGDLVSTGFGTRIFASVMMLVGVALISSMTAIVTSFLTNKDALEEEQDRLRRMMSSMMRHYAIPYSLRREVITLFPTVLEATSEKQFKEMIHLLPTFIERRVDDYLRAKLLRQVPLFADLPPSPGDEAGAPPEIVLELSRKLNVKYASQGDYILNAGDTGDEMYIIVHGAVDVLIPTGNTVVVDVLYDDGTIAEEEQPEERTVATLRSGTYFGEIALTQETTRTASVQAISNCELLMLAKCDFVAALKSNPDLQRAVAEATARRQSETSRQKAVVKVLGSTSRASTANHASAHLRAVARRIIADRRAEHATRSQLERKERENESGSSRTPTDLELTDTDMA
jgi:CRP-like cAMP-binding protein